jgi:hypothetical protein
MKAPILKHRQELAEQGVEQTPKDAQEWFDDATTLFKACGVDVPPEELTDVVDKLKDELPPPDGPVGEPG